MNLDKGSESVSLTPSDKLLIAENFMKTKKEEEIFDRITQNLKSENVSYAIALLESFYEKFEEAKGNRRQKLPEILQSIENKSQNLMAKMEKNVWLKVLSLLEKISDVLATARNNDDFEGLEGKLSEKISRTNILEPKIAESLENLENQVLKAKKLMSTIQILNNKLFVDYNEILTQSPIDVDRVPVKRHGALRSNIETTEPFLKKQQQNFSNANIFSNFRNSLQLIKTKMIPSKSQLGMAFPMGREMNEYESVQYEGSNTNSVHETKKTIRLSKTLDNFKETRQKETLGSLRKEIRKKRLQIQYLMNFNCNPVLPEVQAIKDLVSQKMQKLEETIFLLETNQHRSKIKREEKSLLSRSFCSLSFFNLPEKIRKLSEKTSFLNLTKTYKNFLVRSTTVGFASEKEVTAGTLEKTLQTNRGQTKVSRSSFSSFVTYIKRVWTANHSLGSSPK